MRRISFSMTTQAFIGRRKTVTRRLGWWNLKPGDVLMGVEKAQGLKKGEKQVCLGRIRIVSAKKESLTNIYGFNDECSKEGFPNMTSFEFAEMFALHNRCSLAVDVNRIEFEYLD